MQQHFNQLVLALAERLGQPVNAQEGETSILFDFEEYPVLVDYLAAAEQVLIAAPIADLPEGPRETLYAALLQGQYLFGETHGATLSIDPEAAFASLAVAKDISALTPEAFPSLVEGFLQVADHWREVIGQFGNAPQKPADAPAFAPDALMMLQA
jgi:hypothetical protein